MRNGKFKIGKYNIEPTTSVDTFPSGEYNAVNTKNGVVYISKKPLELCGSDFWVTIYFEKMNIKKIELNNANEKYKMNYRIVNGAIEYGADTVLEELCWKNKSITAQEVEALLVKLNLEAYAHDFPLALSKGQRLRVVLGAMLAKKPQLLLLDEPVSGLDPVVTAEMYDAIRSLNREKGVTVIMVSHDIHNALHCCNKMLHMAQGKYFFGTKEEYKQIPEFKAMAGGCLNDK